MPCLNTKMVPPLGVPREEFHRTGGVVEPDHFFSVVPGENVCLVPRHLGDEESLPLVEHLMLDAEGHQAHQRLNIIDFMAANAAAEKCLAKMAVGVYPRTDNLNLADTSFSQQMHAVMSDPPDVILATYRSAVPTLDAVNGYCKAMGVPVPHLDIVDVSQYAGVRQYGEDHRQQIIRKSRREITRLSSLLRGANTVVIDEFFDSGRTLWDAASIAEAAGATAVRGIIGYWYRKLTDDWEAPSVADIRAPYADFMFRIGTQSAEVPILDKPQISATEIAADFRG